MTDEEAVEKAEQERQDAIYDAVHKRIAQAVGVSQGRLRQFFCVETVVDVADPATALAALEQVAIPGRCRMVIDPYTFGRGVVYKGKPLDSPTWLDLAVDFERSFDVTGDLHHHFLERVGPGKTVDGVNQLFVFAGS